tara:strand:+ start:952 stop:1353 length:402 start_codon:yes stop_codon:yes gene_type:complete
MDYYKTSKDNWSVIEKYNTEAEAQAVADSLGSGYTVEYLYPYVPPSVEDRLEMDQFFCNDLVNIFLQDNRIAGVTAEQGEVLMGKFVTTLSFAQVGAITSVDYHIKNITTDDVFTQERKDKYIQLISNYLNQF